MSRKTLIVSIVTLALGFGAGFAVGRATAPTTSGGAYFCCDASGGNCVHSPDGDCATPLKWCSETRNVNGTITCAVW